MQRPMYTYVYYILSNFHCKKFHYSKDTNGEGGIQRPTADDRRSQSQKAIHNST